MRVVVVGASGLFGAAVVGDLSARGVDVVAAQRSTGVDAYQGSGLSEAFAGADVVVDCLNLMTTRARRAIDFFGTSATNIGRAAASAGASVVCLSIVNANDPAVNAKFGYYQGKSAQEKAYREVLAPASPTPAPLTIVASTQWYDLAAQMMSQMRLGPLAVVPHMRCRPAAVGDVAAAFADVVTTPVTGAATEARRVEIAGPDELDLLDVARAIAQRDGSPRKVFGVNVGGAAIREGGLIPAHPDVVTPTTLTQWLAADSDGRG
ncbi:SDR family oxidoreductase [Gordonia sp. ABSL1-1]|uniref:SDR family oxidoreductase n=1 Tax=Gordonia sp. ABSL1-1 TaxID=3053923 RepID=UPI00257310AF|nr:SDR family oxidoreductase [Gordonia sp. ABSL1-1]MDL9938352.1 SDR family oxidoreductase [Gordonia sp. ABSL1-1]